VKITAHLPAREDDILLLSPINFLIKAKGGVAQLANCVSRKTMLISGTANANKVKVVSKAARVLARGFYNNCSYKSVLGAHTHTH
jgi:hypothetical protein